MHNNKGGGHSGQIRIKMANICKIKTQISPISPTVGGGVGGGVGEHDLFVIWGVDFINYI